MTQTNFTRWATALGAACLLSLGTVQAHADAGALKGRYADLREQMRNNSYGRPLHIDSTESSNNLQGDVYAVLDHPFERVSSALQDPNAWCDIMMLPFNTKACKANGQKLAVRIGRKYNQPVDQAYGIDFSFANVAANASYLQTRLNAAEGPLGTRDYRIEVEAVPLEGGKTFMHMSYSYGFGGAGRFAMQAYLATAGASKVGFTANGVRGAVERNAMRYYLAIDAYLDTMSTPAAQRVDRRIERWFAATERYPKQLHEMDQETYVAMKREEYGRQQTAAIQ
ncbi:MAG: Signal peptide protein-like protein [Ramlibacter sp.]|nr:Signal peptide protein-like protein [Ramlibacter sp.]